MRDKRIQSDARSEASYQARPFEPGSWQLDREPHHFASNAPAPPHMAGWYYLWLASLMLKSSQVW